MIAITIKNIPAKVHRQLKKRALANKRSLNNEVLYCLEQVVNQPVVDVKELLKSAQEMRSQRTASVTSVQINEFKNQGRA